ncbi:MAG TPA: hypothetical protein VH589_25600 [Trebonia sp.]
MEPLPSPLNANNAVKAQMNSGSERAVDATMVSVVPAASPVKLIRVMRTVRSAHAWEAMNRLLPAVWRRVTPVQ